MSSFCLGPYWDNRKTWYTDDPDFTDCFEKTILVWIPAAFLWILAPFRLCLICRTDKTETSKLQGGEKLFWAKVVLTIVLTASNCAEMGQMAKQLMDVGQESRDFPPTIQYADIVAAVLGLLTYALYIALLYSAHRKGKQSSGVFFAFWLILVVTEGIRLRTAIKYTVKHGLIVPIDRFQLALSVVHYAAIVLQLVLSPIRGGRADTGISLKKPSPEEHSTFLSQVLFWWFNSLIHQGWKNSLTIQNLWSLNVGEKARTVSLSFFKKWDKRKEDLALGRVLLFTFWPELLYSALLKLLYNVMLFLVPEILRLLMSFVKNRSQELWKGYLFAVMLLLASAIQTISIGHYFHHANKLGLRLRTALMCAVYRKVVRVAQFADATEKLGQSTNLISVDAQRVMDLGSYINQIWEIPLQIGIAMYLLWDILGASAMAGFGVMVLSMPIEALVAFYSKRMQIQQMTAKDARIKLTGEVFRTIKLLKLYAWDESYEKRILKHRNEELRSLRVIAFLTAFSTFYSIVSPFIIALATFATYVLSDNNNLLDSSKAFVSLSIFNILKNPMNMLPPTISSIVQALVSKNRLSVALASPEPKSYVEVNNNPQYSKSGLRESKPAVVISQGDFAWSKEGQSCLKDIKLSVRNGKLIGIVGPAGSGKTALCRAILGLMDHRNGNVKIGGSIAYMPQQSWLQNRTFKENIIFGRPFHRTSYQTMLEECALMDDLSGMPAGENTLLSDEGSNLSGGQKQRICLARTVYGYADVFILDDPLSALDAKVSKQVFEKVLGPNGLLNGKTRIVVINGYQFLPFFDQLIVMDAGQISEVGTFAQLLDKGGSFSEFLHTHLRHEIEALHADELEETEASHRHVAFKEVCRQLPSSMRASLRQHRKSLICNKRRRSSLVSRVHSLEALHDRLQKINSRSSRPDSDEEAAGKRTAGGAAATQGEGCSSNRTNWGVYWSFLRTVTIRLSLLILITNTISTAFSVASNIWLSQWAQDNLTMANGGVDGSQRDYRLGIYAALGGLQGFFFFISMMSLAYGLILSSKVLHSKMLHHLIRAPTYFFDVTPLGRVTNRFSKDVDAIDVNVPQSLRQCLNSIFNILATLTVLIYSYPLFTAFMVPIAILYFVLLYFYISTSRQLKQLESVSRSPIFSHFQETLSGAGLINIFGQQHRFTAEFEQFLDSNTQVAYLSLVAQRWLSIRLELIGNIIAFIAAILAVYGRDHWDVQPGTVGLTITYAVQVTQVLSWFVQKVSDLEMSFISVQRIKEYTKCPQEAKSGNSDQQAPANWPTSGAIKFENYKTRYRPDLEFALKGISCEISAREKIGIVGRTGAGKSSLSLGIFRIIEAAGGKITIDDIDISKIGLQDLRTRITIIPQDPFLLSGSLRENLDPTETYPDEAIWDALEAANLRSYVMNSPNGLMHQVEEGGVNFSAGQRQMICLARAILRKPKILIMDEATASLDAETDELLQKSIQTEFADCTVLIIAHRLQSVMECNRVMVLDKGEIKEFDSPEALLKNSDSLFHSLAEDANLLDTQFSPSGSNSSSLLSEKSDAESKSSTAICQSPKEIPRNSLQERRRQSDASNDSLTSSSSSTEDLPS